MTKELVISSNRHETKVALLEDDQLVEIFFQRSNEYSLVGSIHKGRVTRVLPGMQSAFVELGLERDAFLYVSDFLEQTGEDYERVAPGDAVPASGGVEARGGEVRSGDRDARGGGGRRGDRDRGGNRGGDRGDRPPRPAMLPVTPAPMAGAGDAVAPSPMTIDAVTPVSGETGIAAGGERPQGQPGQESDQDRRGRGRRRRRRGGRGPGGGAGMPDSKFASPTDGESDDNDDDTVDSSSEAPEQQQAEPMARPDFVARSGSLFSSVSSLSSSPEELEPLVLPGESIAKYRPSASGPVRQAIEARAAMRPVSAPPVLPIPAHVVPAVVPVFEAPVVVPEPVAVVEDKPVAEPAAAEEDEVRELVAEHIETHVAALDVEAEAAEEAADLEDSEEEGGAEAEVEDEVDAMQAAAEAAIAGGGTGGGEQESSQAGVRQDQPNARFVQRRDRGRRRGGRNGGGGSGGGGSRSGGGERYDSVPRTEGAPATVEAREGQPPSPVGPRLEQRERNDRDRPRDRERPPVPSISDLLKEGQEIIVQIYKEPLGTKGARITSHVAMPGRYVVFMPTADHHGVSRKLGDDAERQRLKRIVQTNSQGMVGGFIVRTAGEGKPEPDIAADMSNLYNQWLDIRKKAEKRRSPCLLHSDLELVSRTLRDQVNDQYKAIWTDNEEMYEMIVGFLELFQPALVSRVKLYSREAPIFDTFNITSELEKALKPKVWLKSGGYIVINQTEALVAIDINTGKFVGKSNRLEDTIVKTNVEAVKELVRQIRLRDLGGIIVVDFIDMEERKNRQKVMQALEEAMASDRAPYKILQFNDFGLVAITRRRVKQSLERALCSPCPTCEGAGYVKSVQTVMSEILTEAHKIRPGLEGKDVMLRVNPEVAKEMKAVADTYLKELEEILGRVVIVKSDPLLHPDKFDLA